MPALQRTLGNHAVLQQLSQRSESLSERHADHPVLQRRVAVAKNSMSADFVELTSINYTVQRSGGPVELMKDADFSTMTQDQELYIIAHGKPGQAGDIPAATMVRLLLNGDKALKNPIKAIRFTSCYGGKGVSDDTTDSFVATITSGLNSKGWNGVEVSGSAPIR